MLENIQVANFTAVPYLEASALIQNNPEGISFSTTKPNVVVGPNGAGKSALLKALALKTLSFYLGVSAFDDNYTVGRKADSYWGDDGHWNKTYNFLPGLTCEGTNGTALYYRPGAVPGDERSITTAMMCGYFNEARAYGNLVSKKSSGQQSIAVLEHMLNVLEGQPASEQYQFVNWRFGQELRDTKNQNTYSFERKAEVLKALYGVLLPDAVPLLLMDEPELSLDAKAEVLLWNKIANADCSKLQVIVATHSLYPLMHPEKFQIIEAVPGYAAEVQALI